MRPSSGSGYPSSLESNTRSRHRSQQFLSDAEYNEVFTRQLESVNPLEATNVVLFNHHTGEFVPSGAPSPVINLLQLKSSAILKTSAEAVESDDFDEYSDFVASCYAGRSGYLEKSSSAEAESRSRDLESLGAIYKSARPQKEKKIINAFNYSEKAVQTKASSFRTADTQTISPVVMEYSHTISSSVIFDAYVKDFAEQSKNKNKTLTVKPEHNIVDEEKTWEEKIIDSCNLMERVICQNVFKPVFLDFKFYEDPADEFRPDGRLLPLWSFSLAGSSLGVTDLEWSHNCLDLFAATFGNLDDDSEGGVLAIFSLKKCLHPDYVVKTNCAALCVSLNSHYTSLIAVGFLDGHVAVYDCANSANTPIYSSDFENKHQRRVNAIRWHDKLFSSFYSLSSDGTIKHWQLMPTCLIATTCFYVEMPTLMSLGPEGVNLNVKCGGLRFAFHPEEKDIYLVGTLEGYVMKSSIQRDREPLFAYHAHRLSVYRISFNPYVHKTFISCSADWTVKLWDENRSDPLLTFDLGSPVVDVKWSPYTSTVFAAVTSDGYVHIFDLNIDYYRSIHKQKVLQTTKGKEPTQLSFNKTQPILIVADKRGVIKSLKLSPNLRIPAKGSKKENLSQRELEVRKFLSFLSLMAPETLTIPTDTPAL